MPVWRCLIVALLVHHAMDAMEKSVATSIGSTFLKAVEHAKKYTAWQYKISSNKHEREWRDAFCHFFFSVSTESPLTPLLTTIRTVLGKPQKNAQRKKSINAPECPSTLLEEASIEQILAPMEQELRATIEKADNAAIEATNFNDIFVLAFFESRTGKAISNSSFIKAFFEQLSPATRARLLKSFNLCQQ